MHLQRRQRMCGRKRCLSAFIRQADTLVCYCVNFGNSLNQASAALVNGSVSSSSQSNSAIYICCSSFFALMVNGAINPNEIQDCGYLFQKISFCILHNATECVLSECKNILIRQPPHSQCICTW